MKTSGRRATVVLVRHGEVIGQLPPVSLEMPWWPEAGDVVAAVRERDAIEVTVLRLLRTEPGRSSGGAVSYLAETEDEIHAGSGRLLPAAVDGVLREHPLRQSWARPGGPAALLSWADDRLDAQGVHRLGSAEQMRSWNLSALWRLPTTAGRIWLKAVPDFFAHEGAVIDWVGTPTAPVLYDFAPGRALIGDIPGTPNHEVSDPHSLRPMVELLVDLQARASGRLDELLDLGVPDRRLDLMLPEVAAVVKRWGVTLQPPDRRSLEALLADLPARLTAIAGCGVPDTLVHGDFHPGNVAGARGGHVILDWGDSFVGQPLIDELAFADGLPVAGRVAARSWFADAWQRRAPGCDPERAITLLEPLLPLLAAAMYDRFCAGIEPDEQVYHSADAVQMLRRAALHGRLG